MHRPINKVYTTSGNQTPILLDRYTAGYRIDVQMKTAGAVYTVQYSLDDPTYDPVASTNANTPVRWSSNIATSGTWFNSDDALLIAASTNRSSTFVGSYTAIRLSISAKCSAGNPVVFNLVPYGMDGN